MESEIQPQIPFSPEEFQAYFQEKAVPAREYVRGWEAQAGGGDSVAFKKFRRQVLEGNHSQMISGFPEEARVVFELAMATKIDSDWGDPPEETTDYLARKSAEFILSKGITDTGYVEIPSPSGVRPPVRERELGLPNKKRIAFPRERRKVTLGSKRNPKEPSEPKFRKDHRISHSRLISSGKILSEKAFKKAQENPRVRLWAFHHDPQEQNPGKRLKPMECLDIQGMKYEDVLIQAIRIKTEYETPAQRILFETFVSEVKRGDEVRESVAEIIMKL